MKKNGCNPSSSSSFACASRNVRINCGEAGGSDSFTLTSSAAASITVYSLIYVISYQTDSYHKYCALCVYISSHFLLNLIESVSDDTYDSS